MIKHHLKNIQFLNFFVFEIVNLLIQVLYIFLLKQHNLNFWFYRLIQFDKKILDII